MIPKTNIPQTQCGGGLQRFITRCKILPAILFAAALAVVMSCVPAVKRPDVEPPPAAAAAPIDETPWFVEEEIPAPTDTVPEYMREMGFGGGIVTPQFESLDFGDTLPQIGAYDEVRLHDPVAGGRAVIYSARPFMDDLTAEFVRLNPFGEDGGDRSIFAVSDSTHRRIGLTLARPLVRANGRRVTSLDFIEMWSRFVKSRPAQGRALFANVQGTDGFISGSEPVISGLSAADENNLTIRFATADPLGFHRLGASKLIGGPFMLGAYYTAEATGGRMRLLPNPNSPRDTARLAELVIRTGGDPDPLASFAAGQYTAVVISRAVELEVARRGLMDGGSASLVRLPSDRYFLACRIDDADARAFVRLTASGAELLNRLGVSGEEIASVASAPGALGIPRPRSVIPQLPRPLRILYRNDDPISEEVASKLFDDARGAGVHAERVGAAVEAYETALVRGAYDCAVGWVPETVLTSVAEELHLASMWFSDDTDAAQRLRDHREIPLFSADNWLLMNEASHLHRGRLVGLWMSR